MTALTNAIRIETRTEAPGTILLVNDHPIILRCLERTLAEGPFAIVSCTSAQQAINIVENHAIQVVVTDVSMPEMSGLELMRKIHCLDADIPVVLLTGVPCLDTAAEAVEHGAFSYLTKPAPTEVLLLTLERAIHAYRAARQKREALRQLGWDDRMGQLDQIQGAFQEALQTLWLAYQPVVSISDRRIIGYEALLRSDHAILQKPESFLDAAEQLCALDQLSRRVRQEATRRLLAEADDILLFVNLHPRDLLDTELRDPSSPLSQVADRVVLEITERCGLSRVDNLPELLRDMRRLGFRFAVDDLGAGYSGLANIAMLEPEFIKLDMALIRNIDQSPIKQKLVSSLVSLSRNMTTSIIAEGIETTSEYEKLLELGCNLLQGYLFAKPEKMPPNVRWPEVPRVTDRGGEAAWHRQSGTHVIPHERLNP